MKRWIWLAVGPVLVIAVGVGLMLILPEDGKPTKRMGNTAILLPSGLEAELHEMLWDRPGQGLTYRFRFVAPEFRPSDDVDTLMVDLEHLCTEYALPKLANTGPMPNQVVISLADQPAEFGQYNPDINQVFEAYSVRDGTCIWEMF